MKYSQKYLHDFGILRDFCGNGYKLVSLSSYRQSGFDDDKKFTAKGEAGNDGKLDNNISRTKSRIRELALCNPWEWFVTLTLDQKKYDRTDLAKFIRDLGQTIRDYRKRTENPVKYLLIPERHKDGCWHLHGFLHGLPVEALHLFGKEEHLPRRILERLKSGTPVYTWPEYAGRFGFAVMERIDNLTAISHYITKYITKDMVATITELNAHAFYASKGLNSSTVMVKDLLPRPVSCPDYENEHCAVKWFDDPEKALAAFAEVVPT